jgi:hypothetical protein
MLFAWVGIPDYYAVPLGAMVNNIYVSLAPRMVAILTAAYAILFAKKHIRRWLA